MAIAADAADFVAEEKAKRAHPIRTLLLCALLGLFLILVNFPNFLTRTIELNVPPGALRDTLEGVISSVQWLVGAVIGTQTGAFFERAMTCSFFLFWAFLALLAAFSLRRRGIRMLAYGSGGIVAGYFVVHLLAWAAAGIALAVGAGIAVVRWVKWGIGEIVFLVGHYLWPFFLLAVVAGVAFALYRNWAWFLNLLQRIGRFLRARIWYILGGAIGMWLCYKFFPALYQYVVLPVWNFIASILGPIGTAILFLFKWALIIIFAIALVIAALVACVLSLALVGSLLVSQLQASWHAARSLRDVLVAGFAIGSALALIVVTCIATPALDQSLNHAWLSGLLGLAGTGHTHVLTDTFLFLMPESVKHFVFTYLTNLKAPAVDSFTFLAVMTLASLSVLFRLFSASPLKDKHPPLSFLVVEYGKIIGGAFVLLFLIFLASETGDSSA